MKTRTSIIDTIIASLCFLFTYTALSKYFEIQKFEFSLNESPILSKYTTLIAYTLPGIEIVAVLLLIVPKFRTLGLYIISALLLLFTLYLIGMLSFAKKLPCGCGGIISDLSWTGHVVLNIFFLSLSIIAIKLIKPKILQQ
jgi:putative oxidoreductase